jgi:midasin
MLEGHENSGKQGETQNIISKLKSEWSESKGPSEIGPKSCQSNNEALNKVQVINSSEDFKRPETSDLYTFTEMSLETAPAASSEPNNSNLPEHLENPSKSETQILDCNEDLLNSTPQSKPEVSQPSKEPEKPSSLSTFLQFQEGSRSSGKQPVLSTSSIHSEINENFEILPQTPPEAYEIEAWQDLERETSSISSELCEQLRILLEPTKAKSLKGDYKTGKRINMKKVIAYIASSYRKDKIWLRRTRQTAREYQVLIAIDDSFSMKQNGLGPVATKGLAALAQALNKLEVGQLAVAAIREGLSVLHDFSNFFLPEDGAFVLNQLKFAYGRDKANDNCYANFVNQTQSFLRSRGNNEMQLVVVISDGRMNKDKVRPCLRKSDGIFYLFVIVDNQDSSVFDMKSTVISKKDGKSSVKVFPYLEDFPFEFYVVVQSTDLLVHVLADVVRQWFELIRN